MPKIYLTVVLVLVVTALSARAEDWTVNGKDYHNVIVGQVEADKVHITYGDGVGTIKLADLPPDLQKRFNYDPTAAAKASANEQAREDASDAMVAQVKAQGKTATQKADQDAEARNKMVQGAVFIHGKVLQKTDDGLIVDCDSDKYEAGPPGGPLKLVGEGVKEKRIYGVAIFLTNYPNQAALVDGSPVSLVAYPTRPFSYTNTQGANTTIASYTATLPAGN